MLRSFPFLLLSTLGLFIHLRFAPLIPCFTPFIQFLSRCPAGHVRVFSAEPRKRDKNNVFVPGG
jgi:hypothetical protein